MRKTDAKKKSQHVDAALIQKAITAVIKHHEETVAKKEESGGALSLLGNERAVQVQFGLEVPPGQGATKVVRIDIPHPIHQTANTTDDDDEGLEEADVCLIVKESSKPWIQAMVEDHAEAMGNVKKVLTLDSLRKKHARFEQRRELLKKYDVFMADDRILPMLTKALGKDFIKAKKLPLPLSVTRKDALPFAIQKNLAATYMTISQGTSIVVRAGNTGMPVKKLVENVVSIAENSASKISRQWANIRSIAIKTPDSTSLPFYHKLPEDLVEIARLAGLPTGKADDKTDEAEKSDEPTKRKRDLAAKSPLVKALKKQKQATEEGGKTKGTKKPEKGEEKKSKKKKEKEEEDESPKKKRKTSESSESSEKTSKTPKSTTKAEAKKSSEKASTSEKKKKKPTKEEAPESTSEKKKKKPTKEEAPEFVASKKFKGSKEGYVFRKGPQGIGYYVDHKPVVDKMMVQALIRSASSGSGGSRGGKRSKSGGKKRGRR